MTRSRVTIRLYIKFHDIIVAVTKKKYVVVTLFNFASLKTGKDEANESWMRGRLNFTRRKTCNFFYTIKAFTALRSEKSFVLCSSQVSRILMGEERNPISIYIICYLSIYSMTEVTEGKFYFQTHSFER